MGWEDIAVDKWGDSAYKKATNYEVTVGALTSKYMTPANMDTIKTLIGSGDSGHPQVDDNITTNIPVLNVTSCTTLNLDSTGETVIRWNRNNIYNTTTFTHVRTAASNTDLIVNEAGIYKLSGVYTIKSTTADVYYACLVSIRRYNSADTLMNTIQTPQSFISGLDSTYYMTISLDSLLFMNADDYINITIARVTDYTTISSVACCNNLTFAKISSIIKDSSLAISEGVYTPLTPA